MSKVINLAGTLRAVSPYIRTEDEAIEVAKALANEIRTGFNRHDQQSILSHHTPERVAQSGILGISVPTEYGGADISNPFLAEVVALLSEVDSSIGQIPQNHFHILEVLRLAGSE
jgi:alkylation response protein AidB-like acyl-CoA dehydrogenase